MKSSQNWYMQVLISFNTLTMFTIVFITNSKTSLFSYSYRIGSNFCPINLQNDSINTSSYDFIVLKPFISFFKVFKNSET